MINSIPPPQPLRSNENDGSIININNRQHVHYDPILSLSTLRDEKKKEELMDGVHSKLSIMEMQSQDNLDATINNKENNGSIINGININMRLKEQNEHNPNYTREIDERREGDNDVDHRKPKEILKGNTNQINRVVSSTIVSETKSTNMKKKHRPKKQNIQHQELGKTKRWDMYMNTMGLKAFKRILKRPNRAPNRISTRQTTTNTSNEQDESREESSPLSFLSYMSDNDNNDKDYGYHNNNTMNDSETITSYRTLQHIPISSLPYNGGNQRSNKVQLFSPSIILDHNDNQKQQQQQQQQQRPYTAQTAPIIRPYTTERTLLVRRKRYLKEQKLRNIINELTHYKEQEQQQQQQQQQGQNDMNHDDIDIEYSSTVDRSLLQNEFAIRTNEKENDYLQQSSIRPSPSTSSNPTISSSARETYLDSIRQINISLNHQIVMKDKRIQEQTKIIRDLVQQVENLSRQQDKQFITIPNEVKLKNEGDNEDDCSICFDDDYLESMKSSESSLYTIPKPSRPMTALTVFEIGV